MRLEVRFFFRARRGIEKREVMLGASLPFFYERVHQSYLSERMSASGVAGPTRTLSSLISRKSA